MHIVAIIQARMGSTRFPGKIGKDLGGKPVLVRCVERAKRAASLNAVIVATTDEPSDEAVVALCKEHEYPWFRGSQDDVLDRYYQTAQQYDADVVVRITSDCPLIEPDVIDRVVQAFCQMPELDYASNILPPRTFPRGLDVEVFSFATLEQAWQSDTNPNWREHVTPYMHRQPDVFKLHGVFNDVDYSHYRWTVDTMEDLAFVRKIYDAFAGDDTFSWREVLHLLERHPEWQEINRSVQQKEVA